MDRFLRFPQWHPENTKNHAKSCCRTHIPGFGALRYPHWYLVNARKPHEMLLQNADSGIWCPPLPTTAPGDRYKTIQKAAAERRFRDLVPFVMPRHALLRSRSSLKKWKKQLQGSHSGARVLCDMHGSVLHPRNRPPLTCISAGELALLLALSAGKSVNGVIRTTCRHTLRHP